VQAIKSVGLAAKRSLKAINAAAGRRIARGDYSGADAIVAKGREVIQFQGAVAQLLKQWRSIHGGVKGQPGKRRKTAGPATPLWQYYQPVLQAIVQLGGVATREQIEPLVERTMTSTLQTRDHETLARGRVRWQEMVRRTHKPMVAEGWIEKKGGFKWRITDAGKKTAERGAGKEPSVRRQVQ
jgi:hypothetical protein